MLCMRLNNTIPSILQSVQEHNAQFEVSIDGLLKYSRPPEPSADQLAIKTG